MLTGFVRHLSSSGHIKLLSAYIGLPFSGVTELNSPLSASRLSEFRHRKAKFVINLRSTYAHVGRWKRGRGCAQIVLRMTQAVPGNRTCLQGTVVQNQMPTGLSLFALSLSVSKFMTESLVLEIHNVFKNCNNESLFNFGVKVYVGRS